jgi:hypothetical protein
MGEIRYVNPTILSTQQVVMESGKLMTMYWRDVTMNKLLVRAVK